MSSQTEGSPRIEPAPPEVMHAFKLLFDALLRKYERERRAGSDKAENEVRR